MKIMEKDYFLREEEGKYQATHETLKLTEEQRRFFERDVVVHCKQLFRYLSTLSRDYELSRDMVQETMIVAQRYYAMGQVRNRENVLGWLRKIARNILVSHFRKQVRMNARLDAHRFQICDNLGWILLDDKFVENVSVEQFCGEDETKESVRKAKVLQNLAILLQMGFDGLSLTGAERSLLYSRHIQCKSFKELALDLGQPLSTVMSRYYALMKRVQKEILAWESEGFLDKKLTKGELLQIAKIRESKMKQARRPLKR